MKITRFSIYSIIVLIVNLGVILWGAYVRATGSGAGCGSHWPLCNGEVIPRPDQVETVVEFTHRLSSAFAFILVLILFFWAFRIFPKGHPARKGAGFSLLFIITEALVGAGLVLFGWVAFNASMARIISMSIHLINTFILLACLSMTIWWSITGIKIKLEKRGITYWSFLLAFVTLLILGVSGAVTALGDTLFPSTSLSEGIKQDFSSTAHFLIQLRVWHPIVAIITGSYIFLLSLLIALFFPLKRIRTISVTLIILFFIQLGAGLINVLLLAPVWMQLVHLLLADFVWICLVFLCAETLSYEMSIKSQEQSSISTRSYTYHIGDNQ